MRGDTPSQAGGAWRGAIERSPLLVPAAELRVQFELPLDRDTFVDRIRSISFIAALDDRRREAVLARVWRLASAHPEPWAYMAEVYVYERGRRCDRGRASATVGAMREEPETRKLKKAQTRRELDEQELARRASDEQEAAQHQRRSEKARYLKEKLEERGESEREPQDPSN